MTETIRRKRRLFSEEFKREAVALLKSSHGSTSEVSAELGIGPSLLSRWAREFEETDGPERRPTYEELESELRRLRKAGLSGIPRKKRRRAPVRAGSEVPDLLLRTLSAELPNAVWVTDITRIATGEGKLYP